MTAHKGSLNQYFYQRQESKKTRFYPKTLRLYYHYHPHRIVCLDKWISLCETNSPMIGCTFKVLLTDSSHLCEACSSGSYRVTQTCNTEEKPFYTSHTKSISNSNSTSMVKKQNKKLVNLGYSCYTLFDRIQKYMFI